MLCVDQGHAEHSPRKCCGKPRSAVGMQHIYLHPSQYFNKPAWIARKPRLARRDRVRYPFVSEHPSHRTTCRHRNDARLQPRFPMESAQPCDKNFLAPCLEAGKYVPDPEARFTNGRILHGLLHCIDRASPSPAR